MARTTIDIDNRLIQEGLKLTRLRTKKELVNHALAELIRHAKRKNIQKLAGKVEWEGNLSEMRANRG